MTHLIAYKIILLLTMSLIWGCSSGDGFRGGDNEEKPVAYSQNGFHNVEPSENTFVFKGTYNFIIRKKRNNKIICQGTATITRIGSNTATKGKAECDDPTFKLVKPEITIGGGDETEISVPFEELQKLDVDTRFSRISQKGNTRFIPFRPNFIGPVVQDVEKFSDIDFKENFQVIHETGDPENPREVGDGSIHAKVLESGISYQPVGHDKTYDNVIRYQLNAEGFSTLSAPADIGLYDVYEMYYSTKPIVILNVHIESDISDFEYGKANSVLGDWAFGALVIDLDLIKFQTKPDE